MFLARPRCNGWFDSNRSSQTSCECERGLLRPDLLCWLCKDMSWSERISLEARIKACLVPSLYKLMLMHFMMLTWHRSKDCLRLCSSAAGQSFVIRNAADVSRVSLPPYSSRCLNGVRSCIADMTRNSGLEKGAEQARACRDPSRSSPFEASSGVYA